VVSQSGGVATEITDKFVGGVCYVQLVHDGEVLYLTVLQSGGCAGSLFNRPAYACKL